MSAAPVDKAWKIPVNNLVDLGMVVYMCAFSSLHEHGLGFRVGTFPKLAAIGHFIGHRWLHFFR